MTSLCKCIKNCCSWCCQWRHCCMSFCSFCFQFWYSILCIGCGCFLLGMAVMIMIIYLYYSVYVYPGAAVVEPGDVYQYQPEYPMYKREARSEQEDAYVEDYYDDEPGRHDNANEDDIARHKRETSTVTIPTSSKTSQSKSTTSSSSTTVNRSNQNITSNKTSTSGTLHGPQDTGEEEIDFNLSNNLVNAVHAEAERAKIKEPLGLCRNNEDIKMPEMNVTLFPLEQAQEIIMCINDLLKSQTKKHLCVELNDEMSAYLKWLLLTGESKERRKQWKITDHQDDFLFPSTCGSMTEYNQILTEASIAPESSRAVPGPRTMQSASISHDITGMVENEILTTCAPVNPGKVGKHGKQSKQNPTVTSEKSAASKKGGKT